MNKLDNLTAENYQCPAGEENVYHVVIEMKQYNPKTGERISTPSLQKFGRKIFEDVVNPSLIKQGYSLRIVHNPVEYATTATKRAEAAAKAAAKKAQEEREQMKREILAELKASGQIVETKEAKKAGRPSNASKVAESLEGKEAE